jgi:hypothetical protein
MSEAARELKLYIDNDAQLYRQQFEPILKNLMTKIGRGTYDSVKSVKLWGYLCESGAKKYHREFGGSGRDRWNLLFPVADRKQCAEAFRDDFETEAELGNYDHLLPKKYRAKKNPRKPSKATKKAAKRAADRLVRARGSLKGPPGYWTEAEVYWETRGIALIVNWQGHEMFFQGDDAYYTLENLGIDPADVSKVPSLFEVPETIMDEYAHLNWDENPGTAVQFHDRNLGAALHQWHASSGDPIYATGSLIWAGRPVPRDLLEETVSALESLYRRTTSKNDKRELRTLAAALSDAL